MEIAIFESVTTESALIELEAEGQKYNGLYVDMEDAPQRKYVKDKAAEIQGLIKQVNTYRIADKKAYGVKVESQATEIIGRLTDANSNFQGLIDDYTIERKKILDAEKARKQAILDAEQFELDHEIGLLINKTYEFDRAEKLRLAKIESERIEAEALKKAVDRLAALGEKQAQDKLNEENARLANTEHCAKINRAALNELIDKCGLNPTQARVVVTAIAKNEISQITIKY